jgi:long-chain acyl-CoA synthetase
MAEILLPLIHSDSDADRVAIADEFGSFTRAEHNARVNKLIHGLRALGLQDGDVIGVLSGNRHEFFETCWAAFSAGWTIVPLNWHFGADEVAYVLADSGARALVADHEHAERASDASARVRRVDVSLMCGGAAADGFCSYEDLLDGSPESEPHDQSAGRRMFYTSGTTGRPKGVIDSGALAGQPVAGVRARLEAFADLFRIPKGGVALVNAPVYHGGPYLFSMVPLATGSSLVLRRRFDAAETLRLVDEHRVTTAYFVPTHFVRLLRLPGETRDGFDGASLRAVYHAAAPCTTEVKRRMIDWWGDCIFEFYGGTEAPLGTFITSEEWLRKIGSVGRAFEISEIVIVSEDGKRLGPNQDGLVYIRSLLGMDFEYHGDPEKTARAHLEPGVVTVGDVGYLDEDGYLFLTDRKIDMIISGGVNIYPAEIEAVLTTHHAVDDVAVLGVPNEEFGEEVRAFVQAVPGHASPELETELKRLCREHLAGYKTPRVIEFRETLPRTETGKLLKRELRDPYWEGRERAI